MSDQGGTVTLDLIGRMLREVQTEQRAQRAELNQIRPMLLALVDQTRRMERNRSELKLDLMPNERF